MAFHFPTFLTRLGSAIIYSAIMMAGLLLPEWVFISLFFIVMLLCLHEYTTLLESILNTTFTRNETINFLACGAAFYFFTISLPVSNCPNAMTGFFSAYTFHFLGFTVGTLLIFFLFRKSNKAIYLLTGLAYIAGALGFLVQMRFQSMLLPIMMILFIWMNDSLAYLTGSFIGRTPFFPSISPKKTIEGTIGGIVFTMAFALVWGRLTNWFPDSFWIAMGLTASLVGTAGDLVESKLKRLAGVKDSGKLMPGHGGALDRFDSILLAAPFAFLLALFYEICKQVSL